MLARLYDQLTAVNVRIIYASYVRVYFVYGDIVWSIYKDTYADTTTMLLHSRKECDMSRWPTYYNELTAE